MSSLGSSPEELLARWQQDEDSDALDQLLRLEIQELVQRLRSKARDQLRPSVSASDLVQEAVYRMLRQSTPPEFEDTDQLRGYLWTAAWRLFLNRVTGSRKEALSLGDSHASLPEGHATAVDEKAAKNEQSIALVLTINLLKHDDREILEHVYFQQKTPGEAAEELGISQAAAEMRLTRARRRLGEKLDDWSQIIG